MKALIIEDEPLIALTLKIILEKRGFEVVGEAANFEDAKKLFCEGTPDILLSDINLEDDETGIDIVKSLKDICDFEVIYLTSYGSDTIIEEAIATNPIAYITKPFKENDLNAALKLASQSVKRKALNTTNSFIYNKETKVLLYKNKEIILSKQESDLFHICYLSKGSFIPMDSIEYYIWGDEEVANSTRRGLIHRLKKKIVGDYFVCLPSLGCKVVGLQ